MDYWSPALVGTAYFLIIALGMLFANVSPFRRELAASSRSTFPMIDGYRGFLSIGVLIFHASMARVFYLSGRWNLPPKHYLLLFGTDAVMQFFLITGFLFWGKAIGGKVKTIPLYKSRVRRLAPLYLAMAVSVLFVVAHDSNWKVLVTTPELLAGLGKVFSLGLINIGTFNHFNTVPYAGVTWTLQYEWFFYLLLPIVAFFSTFKRFIVLAAVVLVLSVCHPIEWEVRCLSCVFLCGMIGAYVVRTKWARHLQGRWASVMMMGCIFLLAIRVLPFSRAGVILNFLIFLPIACGNSMFGLLTLSGSRFLSTISYSFYLFHCLVLFTLLRTINHFHPIVSLTPIAYWSFITATGIVAVMVSMVTYRLFEHPFLSKKTTRLQMVSPSIIDERMMPATTS